MNSEQPLPGENQSIDYDEVEPGRICHSSVQVLWGVNLWDKLKKCQHFCYSSSCQGSDSLPRHWIFRTKELGHETENLSIFPMKHTLEDEHSGY